MATANVLSEDAFLLQVERVRQEIDSHIARGHEILDERKEKLLDELRQLEDRYNGATVTKQIDELNRLKEVQLNTAKLNENREFFLQYVSQLDAQVKKIRDDYASCKVDMKRVEFVWDLEFESRLSKLGAIKVSDTPDYKYKIKPVIVTCKNRYQETHSDGHFYRPHSVAIDSETKNIYVCDWGNQRIQVFTKSFEFLHSFGENMDKPDGMCICSGKIYVTQHAGHRLNTYTTGGKFLKSVGKKGVKKLEFDRPKGVDVSTARNRIYVCELYNNRLHCLNLNLSFHSLLPDIPAPTDTKLTSEEVIVLTGADYCVSYYNYSHQLLRQMIAKGVGQAVKNPINFCLDDSFNILMTDGSHDCVLIFTSQGELVHKFGGKGERRGEFTAPTGIALDSEYRIIVASHNSEHCLQIF